MNGTHRRMTLTAVVRHEEGVSRMTKPTARCRAALETV